MLLEKGGKLNSGVVRIISEIKGKSVSIVKFKVIKLMMKKGKNIRVKETFSWCICKIRILGKLYGFLR